MSYRFGQPDWMNGLPSGTDIVGWVFDADTFHADCVDMSAPTNYGGLPIFVSDDGSSENTCGKCLKRFRDH